MIAYADASFLVSVYSVDSNFEAAMRIVESFGGQLVTTVLGELEVVNALELRVFRREMTKAEAESCLTLFSEDIDAGVVLLRELPERAFQRARELSRRTTARLGTRAADILHVAAALELGAEGFNSFDRTQRKLAHSVELKLNHYV